MNKIVYNAPELLKKEYLSIFEDSILGLQKKWAKARLQITRAGGKPEVYPENIANILVCDFFHLAEIYYDYSELQLEARLVKRIARIFKYTKGRQSRIADFFRNHAKEIGINTCCYCDIAYVNSYSSEDKKHSHFDLDHVLPKSKCPILSLSLFNLVPCCPVCNQRLKRDNFWGNNVDEAIMSSPTSSLYAFDSHVQLRIVPKDAFPSINFLKYPNKFEIEFVTRLPVYQRMINILSLNDRYEFHKCEALNLMELLEKYPPSNIKMMANSLNSHEIYRTPAEIEEDIFKQKFLSSRHRLFSKLNKDIYKQYRRNEE